jgi:AcrR family transcriptional regulator
MRRVGQDLGVEAMSLYHHVKSKDDIVDGMVDVLVDEIPAPPASADWKSAIRTRALAARALLRRHPWVFRVIAHTSGMSPAMLRYHEAVIGNLLAGGFSNQLTHTAMHVLGSRTLGFTEDLFLGQERGPEVVKGIVEELRAGKYPIIRRAIKDVHHDDDLEFAFGLDLILDGLEQARDAAERPVTSRSGARRS